MADYSYDVFLSYRRTKLVRQWVMRLFKDEFEAWLHEARGIERRIFWDEDGLGAGDELSAKLRDALLGSKCLVSVLSPSYFRESRWCVSEFRTFRKRSEMLGLKVPGLVVPAHWYGKEQFPPEAAALVMTDFASYANISSPTTGFKNKVRAFAEQVASVIDVAPPFDPTWEFVWAEKLDQPIAQRTLAS